MISRDESSTGDELRRLYMAETTGPRKEERSWNTLQSDLREVVGVGLAHRNVRILRRVGRFFDGRRGRFRGRAEMVAGGEGVSICVSTNMAF